MKNVREWKPDLGATVIGKGKVSFKVWAPKARTVTVKIVSGHKIRRISLGKDRQRYFKGTAENVFPGDLYRYLLNNKYEYPDPISRFQPDGVHGPSQVIDTDEFVWEDSIWKGIPLSDFIIYEIHVGTFTKEGTFDAVIPYLDYLKELGITAIEFMPVSQFPGKRNWGYDGAYLFAPQNSYGGPQGMKTLINSCHKKGLAVILDVVYNHLGPEGNYLGNFGPYFTNKYKTPWGDAINFDGPYSDEVRAFFIENALYWITEYHVDALRVDAIHGILDFSAKHFLQELVEAVHEQSESMSRNTYVIAESDLNDVRFINPVEINGRGLDAQWNDDFHHSLHTLITGEDDGYYQDFGEMEHMVKAFKEGFVYSGQYSKFRKRRHGNSSIDIPARQFIVFSQNHDQVGNRMSGDRLAQTHCLEKLKLAAGVVILSPYLPLIFMGEEYGEKAPFQYFINHSDKALVKAVRNGRRNEFASFKRKGEIPDPQAESTFLNSKINIQLHRRGKSKVLFDFYKRLISLRKKMPAFNNLLKENMEVKALEEKVLFVRRWFAGDGVCCVYNFNEKCREILLTLPSGIWTKMLDSSSKEWRGKGDVADNFVKSEHSAISIFLNPYSFVVYEMQNILTSRNCDYINMHSVISEV
jgi:maltooligosyltrehalose trehalohydrolase